MSLNNMFLLQMQQSGEQATPESVNSVNEPANFSDVAEGVVQSEETLPIIDLVIDSWMIMIPLMILSIVAIYIWVERYTALKKASDLEASFMPEIKSAIAKGDFAGAKSICAKSNTPISRMMSKGISRLGRPLDEISKSIENLGRLEVSNLEKNLSILATISGAAPMIGFLGTVIGMMDTFHEMALGGNGGIKIEDLSNGIMFAMTTTVAGLIVGIIAYLGYNLLVSKVDKVVFDMEDKSAEFMDLLHQPASDN